jgi:hypothetical protein
MAALKQDVADLRGLLQQAPAAQAQFQTPIATVGPALVR